jgi:hypothetical protein
MVSFPTSPPQTPSRWSTIAGLIISVLFILYVRNVRQYLDKIETCNCAPLQYVTSLYNLETVLLYLLYVGVVFNAITFVYPGWLVRLVPTILGSNYAKSISALLFMYLLIMLGVVIAFIYNVYEYHKNLKSDCSCIDETESDMLYIQAVYYGVIMVVPVLAIVAVVSIIASSNKN